MGKPITTKAIDAVINDPKKLKRFTYSLGRKEGADDRAYFIRFAYACYTLAKLDDEHRRKFARFIEINEDTQADFAYLCDLISNSKTFPDCDFKVNPILELYEALLKENWETIKSERDLLNSIDAFNKTPDSNVAICEAIADFLKEYVLNASHIHNI